MPNSLRCKIKHLRHNGTLTERECDRILKALEQQPCEDCISRAGALRHKHIVYDDDGIGYSVVRVDEIMALPSVTPKAESKNVLAKIKAEIEQKCCITVGSENEPAITLYDVFQIIDKYKAERKEEPAEWIVDTDDSRRWDRVRFYCSACNGWNTYGKSKYCPDCGRRMQREGLQRENS